MAKNKSKSERQAAAAFHRHKDFDDEGVPQYTIVQRDAQGAAVRCAVHGAPLQLDEILEGKRQKEMIFSK